MIKCKTIIEGLKPEVVYVKLRVTGIAFLRLCLLESREWNKCRELGPLQCTHSWECSPRVLRFMSESISHGSGHSSSWCLRFIYDPVAYLRAEGKINVESSFFARGHAAESTLWNFWDLCLRASLTVVETVHPNVWDYCHAISVCWNSWERQWVYIPRAMTSSLLKKRKLWINVYASNITYYSSIMSFNYICSNAFQ